MPFAAFFVAFLLLLCIPRRSRKLALCLLLGALAGLCAVHTTSARLERVRANYVFPQRAWLSNPTTNPIATGELQSARVRKVDIKITPGAPCC